MLKINYLALLLIVMLSFSACKKEDAVSNTLITSLAPSLSQMTIYKGTMKNLTPADGFIPFDQAEGMFTDSCDKEDLIFIPPGTKMTVVDDRLPVFPTGTIILKTFFYYKNQKNATLASDKTVIETRLMLKTATDWSYATYAWNAEQTDATIVTTGKTIPVGWNDEVGKPHHVNFKIAANSQCITCHQSNGAFLPIGFQIRNINHTRSVDPKINELTHFINLGVMNTCNPAAYFAFDDPKFVTDLSHKARTYLDANCAFCHKSGGDASSTGLYLDYELPLDATGIKTRKTIIYDKMLSGKMPKYHSTIIDTAGVNLVKAFLDAIPN